MRLEIDKPKYIPFSLTFEYESEFEYFCSIFKKLNEHRSRFELSVKDQVIVDKIITLLDKSSENNWETNRNGKLTVKV
jgi:hypothetical protein